MHVRHELVEFEGNQTESTNLFDTDFNLISDSFMRLITGTAKFSEDH